MESLDKSHHIDLESGGGGGSGGGVVGGHYRSTALNEVGISSSDESDGHSAGAEIVRELDKRRKSSVSECSVAVVEAVEEVDLEAGGKETNVELNKIERDCRICHLSLDGSNQESGIPIELGCSCKNDLAAVHKQCAETWFKIKGNKTCEICGSLARNVAGVSEGELSEDDATTTAADNSLPLPAETRNFWHGHRFLNFLLACMVFAFVISWLFHFNVPS